MDRILRLSKILGQKSDNFRFSKSDFLNSIPKNWDEKSVILGQEIFMDGWTSMKIIKHGLSQSSEIKILIQKKRNLKFHFDSFHEWKFR